MPRKKTRKEILQEIKQLPPEKQQEIFQAAWIVAEAHKEKRRLAKGGKPH
jgi:cation transport regulator ChaB